MLDFHQLANLSFARRACVIRVHPVHKKNEQIQTDKHNKVKINIRSTIAQNREGELK